MDKHNTETNQVNAEPVGDLEFRERRGAKRFPVRQDVQYWIADRSPEVLARAGRTLDLSSSGILLTTQEWIQPGRILVVTGDWPARLNGVSIMKFIARGPVVRSEGHQVAMRIYWHEFRTSDSPLGSFSRW